MSESLVIEILRFATKFGIAAAIEIAKGLKGGATIDDAIIALENAEKKTAQQIRDEAP